LEVLKLDSLCLMWCIWRDWNARSFEDREISVVELKEIRVKCFFSTFGKARYQMDTTVSKSGVNDTCLDPKYQNGTSVQYFNGETRQTNQQLPCVPYASLILFKFFFFFFLKKNGWG